MKKHIIYVDRDPKHLTTEKVQLWYHTMMGLIPLQEAREMVISGKYGISTDQAIFLIQDSKYIQYI